MTDDDPHAPARGIVAAVILGLGVWAALITLATFITGIGQ
jgi:hypothetical protein